MGWFVLIFIEVCFFAVLVIVTNRRKKQREIERDFEEFLKKNMDLSKFHILNKDDSFVIVKAEPNERTRKLDGKRIRYSIIDESEETTDEIL